MPGKTRQPTEVILTYRVPVYVVVRDGDDGAGPQVDKVVVDDEVSFDGNRDVARNDSGEVIPNDDPAVAAAMAIVQTGDERWPSWGFGW
jgi:hypothetical protein